MSDKTHQRNLPVPFFSQRENNYRWQYINRDGNKEGETVSLAFGSCNITSLCMILHYFGITIDTPDVMMRKFYEEIFPEFSREAYISGRGPERLQFGSHLKDFVTQTYRLPDNYINHGNEKLTIKDVEKKIAQGYPVWFSYGATTGGKSGHIAVIRGFTEDDDIIINDPWGDVTTPEGNLTPGNTGPYYAASTPGNDKNYGLGNGDNCVLRKEEFKKIAKDNLHQTLVIEYPHCWSFPFRKANGAFRFSSHIHNSSGFREGQISEMLKQEVTEEAGYPISNNWLWHDGIHISGEGPVYAVGPGRLVAARIQGSNKMPDDGDSSFVLVRHQVMINNRVKEFYSHYMHLGPVDIRGRIRRQIAGEETERERDWIDQLVGHIRPKRALVRIDHGVDANNKAKPADGREGDAAPLIHKLNGGQFEATSERLPDRSVIYLYPIMYKEVQQRLESITWEEELRTDMAWFYQAINNDNTYKKKFNGSEYYAYYYRVTGTGNNTAWEIRYVPVGSNIIPQPVNIPEFDYYRHMLAKLISGEVTVFSREKTMGKSDKDKQQSEKPSDLELFIKTVRAAFPEKDILKTSLAETARWATTRTTLYRDIEEYYKTTIVQNMPKGAQGVQQIEEKIKELTGRFCEVGRVLLSFPADMFKKPTDVFTLFDQEWYKGLVTTYQNVLKQAYPNDTEKINYKTFLLTEQLKSSLRANIDYHIEVNGHTKLGTPGRYKNWNSIIHFEIFSDDARLIVHATRSWDPSSRQFISVPKETTRDNYFNVEEIIGSLREAGFLKEQAYFNRPRGREIRERELHDFLNDVKRTGENISLQYAVVWHLHGHAKLADDAWNECISKGRGLNNYLRRPEDLAKFLAYKWFSKEVAEELKASSNSSFNDASGPCAVFYHPVRFLAWLDEQMNSGVRA